MTGSKQQRVIVGMSGGVDSSTAAALLVQQGYDVTGVTLKFWPHDCRSPAQDGFKCCGSRGAADARAVCERLGIPHHVIDEQEEFRREVIHYFAREYQGGRTPNPCILCNERLKFGTLLDRARGLGADYVATGHYARLETRPDGRTLLKRGLDPRRDQSYFLFSLRQDQLGHALFPLGEMRKDDTRNRARAAKLKTADKEESMEICFVPDRDYGDFLRKADLVQRHRGEVVDLDGRVVGHHDGIEFYTIGQRRGLRISHATPLYVVELDAASNQVVVGDNTALSRDEFAVTRCNWVPFDAPAGPLEVTAKIRYNDPGTPATITPLEEGRARVKLHTPQRAITPGQASVFYQGDLVVGGGWITR